MTQKLRTKSFKKELRIKNLNFVVVTARNKDGLLRMEIHAPDWSIVFVKLNLRSKMFYLRKNLVNEHTHPVVPKLDDPAMQGSEHPGTCWVERNT